MRSSVLLLAALTLVVQSKAQSALGPRESTFQVSPASPWTDTGLNLETGDTVTISVAKVSADSSDTGGKRCDPTGVNDASSTAASLPVPEAGPGALIAKLQASAPAVLVGARTELRVDTASHLFLGMNMAGTPPCQGTFEVKVQVSGSNTEDATAGSQPKSRAEQLKSQLANAAQVFMSGQFGIDKPDSSPDNATSATGSGGSAAVTVPAIHISEAPLDPDLQKALDGLPRRVNDQLNNLGDMVNFVIVGSLKDVRAALEASDWHVADTNNTRAVVNAVLQTYDSKDYLAMPMSTLYLFGRKQDFGYEMAEPIAMVASRHHFRIWKAPFKWKGQEVWVGAGTHDIGFAKDKRNDSVTHKIDPAVDGERDHIGASLQKSNKGKTFSYFLPSNPVQEARNATGDGYHSDGRLLVVFLQ
jgi:hypothetical protein